MAKTSKGTAPQQPQQQVVSTGVPTQRYVICPASTFVHGGNVFVRVYRGRKGWATAFCSCRTRIFLPPDWQDSMGLTIQQIPPDAIAV